MSQYYTVTWVGNKTREWSNQYGQFIDYQIAVAEYDPTEHGGSRRTVTLTQKAGTPAPQVGQKIFGGIVVETVTPRQGDPFEVYKLKKESPPNGNGSGQPRRLKPSNSLPQQDEGNGKLPPEFWEAKDRRMSRAGLMQAVVNSGKFNNLTGDQYLDAVDKLTDALLARIDAKAPHPFDLDKHVDNLIEQTGLEEVKEPQPQQTQVPVPEQPPGFPADPDDSIPF